MANNWAPNLSTNATGPLVKTFLMNTGQAAGTYTACTASGDILVKSITMYVVSAAVGLISLAIQTDNITSDIILSTTLLAALTAGKNLTPFNATIYLPTTKRLRYTIVGLGTAGQLMMIVEYYPLTANATLV